MSGNSFGTFFRVTTFGESHGPAIGAVVDGVPAGLPLAVAMIQADLDLRRPGRSEFASARQEADRVEILSGVFEGHTTGAPVALLIRNTDAQPADYKKFKDLYRPGHADWTWEQKFGVRDWQGGGRTSGRETAARVAAGAVARQILRQTGATVLGVVAEIGGIAADIVTTDWEMAREHPLRCPDRRAAKKMETALRRILKKGDSLGGIVAVRARNVPVGLGEPVFDKLEARLGAAMLSIGAVKGVEFGDGFTVARLTGSMANDSLLGPCTHASNHAGGIVGGISNGEEIFVRLAIKPTASIALPQATIDRQGQSAKIRVTGRHDPCIAPRLVAVAEAMTCLVLADFLLLQRARGIGPNEKNI